MFCGSCMHDNTLAAALVAQGHDALLMPTYTPIRTDEMDVSSRKIYFGGINVYLQQKSWLFRKTPWFVDQLLNARWLLKFVSRWANQTPYEDLGDLTISMLKGEHGFQKKEIEKLVHALETELKPQIVNLTNVLLSGIVPTMKERLKIPVLATLQGDDVFLEALPEPYKSQAMDLIRENCRRFDGFVSTSEYYADFMSNYFDIPREKIDIVYPGLNLKGHGGERPERNGEPFTIGYFARIDPDKGFHNIVDAFCILKSSDGCPPCRLRASGWMGEHNRPYYEQQINKLEDANLLSDFEYVDCPDHASKVRFLRQIDVLSVPTTYREPKGLYLLEAWANGIPVVQPQHGSFPELIEATGGGLLAAPDDPEDLALVLREVLDDPVRVTEMGRKAQQVVKERFHADAMAIATVDVYRKYLQSDSV